MQPFMARDHENVLMVIKIQDHTKNDCLIQVFVKSYIFHISFLLKVNISLQNDNIGRITSFFHLQACSAFVNFHKNGMDKRNCPSDTLKGMLIF